MSPNAEKAINKIKQLYGKNNKLEIEWNSYNFIKHIY